MPPDCRITVKFAKMSYNPNYMEKALAALLAFSVPAYGQEGYKKVPILKVEGRSLEGALPLKTPPPLKIGSEDLLEIAGRLYGILRQIDNGQIEDCDLALTPVDRPHENWLYAQAQMNFEDPESSKVIFGTPVYGDTQSLGFLMQRKGKLLKINQMPETCETWQSLELKHHLGMNKALSKEIHCHFSQYGMKEGGSLLAVECRRTTPLELRLTHSLPPSQ